ncbi:MAG: universal stress protein [Pseudolabrys sp.]
MIKKLHAQFGYLKQAPKLTFGRQRVYTIERWSMYRHILIPTDGSDLAEHAVTNGLALAKSLGAKVSVIVVEEPFDWLSVSESTGRQISEESAKHAEQIKKHATSVLNRAANAAKQAGVSYARFRWRTSNPFKPSSQRPRTKAAISSSWHRTGAADYPGFCSAV